MKRPFLLILGWLLAVSVLYTATLLLDVYWNLATWRFKLDAIALALVLCILAALAAVACLARATGDSLTRTLALIASVILAAAAAYALPPEPETTGLFAREAPSPLAYRIARLLWMSLPLAWIILARRPLNR